MINGAFGYFPGSATAQLDVPIKANAVAAGSFTGSPRKATVTFATAFSDTNYSISIVGEDSRSFTIESKTTSGFIINANSASALSGSVYWIAIPYGEL